MYNMFRIWFLDKLLEDLRTQMKLLFEKENERMNIDRQHEVFQCEMNDVDNNIDIIEEDISFAKSTVAAVVAGKSFRGNNVFLTISDR